MRKGAVAASVVDLQEPDDRGQQDDGTFYEEIALLGDPRLIEVQHDRVGRLVGVRDVGHKIAVDRVAAMRAARVVEVDDVEFRRNLIALHVGTQVVVGDDGEVVELEVVDIHRKSLLDLLLDELIDYGIGFSRTGRSQHDRRAEGIDDVDPTRMPLSFVIEQRR